MTTHFLCLALVGGALACCALGSAYAVGPTGLLNDTGQTLCTDGTAMVTCTAANTGNASTYPGQDGRYGRDVTNPTKVGGGIAGFDFTKVCMDGTLNCSGAADTTAAPASASVWACTKDNVTNLVWSLYSGQGDWTTYATVTVPNADNAQSRCGYSTGWRLPNKHELLSIVNFDGSNPAVDANFFPATIAYWYWTNDTYQPDPNAAWMIYFADGLVNGTDKTNSVYGRLVHSGQ